MFFVTKRQSFCWVFFQFIFSLTCGLKKYDFYDVDHNEPHNEISFITRTNTLLIFSDDTTLNIKGDTSLLYLPTIAPTTIY